MSALGPGHGQRQLPRLTNAGAWGRAPAAPSWREAAAALGSAVLAPPGLPSAGRLTPVPTDRAWRGIATPAPTGVKTNTITQLPVRVAAFAPDGAGVRKATTSTRSGAGFASRAPLGVNNRPSAQAVRRPNNSTSGSRPLQTITTAAGHAASHQLPAPAPANPTSMLTPEPAPARSHLLTATTTSTTSTTTSASSPSPRALISPLALTPPVLPPLTAPQRFIPHD